jgi:hypothetical protein
MFYHDSPEYQRLVQLMRRNDMAKVPSPFADGRGSIPKEGIITFDRGGKVAGARPSRDAAVSGPDEPIGHGQGNSVEAQMDRGEAIRRREVEALRKKNE